MPAAGDARPPRTSHAASVTASRSASAAASACRAIRVAPSPRHALERSLALDRRAPRRRGPGGSAPWRWPVPAPSRVVAPFRAPPTPYGRDIAASTSRPRRGAPWCAPRRRRRAASRAGRRPRRPRDRPRRRRRDALEPVDGGRGRGHAVAAGEAIGTRRIGRALRRRRCVHFGVRLHGEYVYPSCSSAACRGRCCCRG